MIDLTETEIDEIRAHAKHRAELRKKLETLRANRGHFRHVRVCFKGEHDTEVLEMTQGERGGLLPDMLSAFEKHLELQAAELTQKIQALGVRVV